LRALAGCRIGFALDNKHAIACNNETSQYHLNVVYTDILADKVSPLVQPLRIEYKHSGGSGKTFTTVYDNRDEFQQQQLYPKKRLEDVVAKEWELNSTSLSLSIDAQLLGQLPSLLQDFLMFCDSTGRNYLTFLCEHWHMSMCSQLKLTWDEWRIVLLQIIVGALYQNNQFSEKQAEFSSIQARPKNENNRTTQIEPCMIQFDVKAQRNEKQELLFLVNWQLTSRRIDSKEKNASIANISKVEVVRVDWFNIAQLKNGGGGSKEELGGVIYKNEHVLQMHRERKTVALDASY